MFRDTVIREIGVTFEKDSQRCYQVNCGCMTFVFIGEDKVREFIDLYLQAPKEVERSWYQAHGEEVASSSIPEPDRTATGTATLRGR